MNAAEKLMAAWDTESGMRPHPARLERLIRAIGSSGLAVIDPQDDAQVERLAQLMWEHRANILDSLDEVVRAALTAYATPAPPPLDEPTEWGARVTDAEGRRWVRTWIDWNCENDPMATPRDWSEVPQPARLGWDEEATR